MHSNMQIQLRYHQSSCSVMKLTRWNHSWNYSWPLINASKLVHQVQNYYHQVLSQNEAKFSYDTTFSYSFHKSPSPSPVTLECFSFIRFSTLHNSTKFCQPFHSAPPLPYSQHVALWPWPYDLTDFFRVLQSMLEPKCSNWIETQTDKMDSRWCAQKLQCKVTAQLLTAAVDSLSTLPTDNCNRPRADKHRQPQTCCLN